jgi:glycosyltransferase involved in cell wall biosynthesis
MTNLSALERVLIIGYVWPETRSSAAGTRMLELIRFFADRAQVVFASAAALSEHRDDLSALGVSEQPIALNCSSFDDVLRAYQPQVVVFDRFFTEEQFGWRVASVCPNAVRVLDTEDLHSVRHARALYRKRQSAGLNTDAERHSVPALWPDNATLFHEMATSDLLVRELAAIYRCDMSLMISPAEIGFLTEYCQVPPSLLVYLPFLTSRAVNRTALPAYNARDHFIAIGNFRHEPNWDSVQWLKYHIWPLIRAQLPKAELHIYGAYPPPKATQLHNAREGFFVKGWVDDASAVMQQARVCLAPLRFGAGIKGKLMDAMMLGTPSVTTPIGVEGMFGENGWAGAMATDAVSFAQQAIDLYRDETAWHSAQAKGFQILDECFFGEDHSARLAAEITHVLANIEQHRLANITGRMLQHHTLKSTQYMSQWIEAKNRIAP